jgi:hypothetical protein
VRSPGREPFRSRREPRYLGCIEEPSNSRKTRREKRSVKAAPPYLFYLFCERCDATGQIDGKKCFWCGGLRFVWELGLAEPSANDDDFR